MRGWRRGREPARHPDHCRTAGTPASRLRAHSVRGGIRHEEIGDLAVRQIVEVTTVAHQKLIECDIAMRDVIFARDNSLTVFYRFASVINKRLAYVSHLAFHFVLLSLVERKE